MVASSRSHAYISCYIDPLASRIHTAQAQSESNSLMHEEEGLQNRNIVHHNVPVTLFDDTAALAMESQKRRVAAGKAEKEEAKEKGVNLEWQRHHHLDGSVY